MNPLWASYIEVLRAQVVPALGCTEPVAVALAAAQCRDLLEARPRRLVVRVSANIYKNGMGVGVPGTGMVGLAIAAALGAVAGDGAAGLEVLHAVTAADLPTARALREATELGVVDANDPLYVEVLAEADGHAARVVICHDHTSVVLRERDGVVLFAAPSPEKGPGGESAPAGMPPMTLAALIAFATEVPLERIAFMEQAAALNSALSDEGMAREYGLRIGRTLDAQVQGGLLSDDLLTMAMRLSSAASDARMDGAMLPAMSNSGSGNQGISATMPVVAAARLVGADREQLIRAVTLSHIVAVYIKSHQEKLSALCAASTAAMGAGAGITWLLGGDAAAIADCIQNMIGDVSGIICDGAKTSCSMKVSTAASSAVKAALLARNHIRVSATEGIVAESPDASIANLGRLARQGMTETDRQIVRIMIDKQDATPTA